MSGGLARHLVRTAQLIDFDHLARARRYASTKPIAGLSLLDDLRKWRT
ncbi:hypothetical protein [Kibdelosporangium phytohabitans]|nr:hypothetical protein [Kibdelosporangium phytohabitans]MBE1468771.1 hypothetical protein [Kibdelosporangium phytohabitans]